VVDDCGDGDHRAHTTHSTHSVCGHVADLQGVVALQVALEVLGRLPVDPGTDYQHNPPSSSNASTLARHTSRGGGSSWCDAQLGAVLLDVSSCAQELVVAMLSMEPAVGGTAADTAAAAGVGPIAEAAGVDRAAHVAALPFQQQHQHHHHNQCLLSHRDRVLQNCVSLMHVLAPQHAPSMPLVRTPKCDALLELA